MLRSLRIIPLLVVLSLLGPAAAGPALGATSAVMTACPPERVPATAFTDTVPTRHRLAIDCAQWWGLVQGRTRTTFVPQESVTRGQAAAMAARLLRTTGAATDEAPSAGFQDTRGHLFEQDIDLLASYGIVGGITSTSFAPDAPINRAQMASILARMFAHGFHAPLPDGPEPFSDVVDGSTHADSIGRLVGAGITTGTTSTRYAPRQSVSREQMASFLTRSSTRLVEAGLAAAPAGSPAAGDPYASTMRAAWVHLFDETLKTRAGIVRMLDELHGADVTTVIAQVIRRHDAYYHSDVLPRTPDPAVAPDFDVLGTLLAEAHARGMEVHAWFSVAPVWHGAYNSLPAPEGWLPKLHGTTAPEADRWVTRSVDGEWSGYLDPGIPAVHDHVEAVVTELAARYPIDGMHLDYTRYQSERHGYHPIALARFREQTQRVDTPAPTDRAWMEWRRAQTRQIVLRARRALDASGRDIALSAAVISWGAGPPTLDRAGFQKTLAYTRTLQDWDEWVRRGYVDAVMPMNYFRASDPRTAAWFDRWAAYEGRLAAESEAAVVPGPGGYLNWMPQVLEQVRTAMTRADGAAIYSYNQPTVNDTSLIWRRLVETRWGYRPAP